MKSNDINEQQQLVIDKMFLQVKKDLHETIPDIGMMFDLDDSKSSIKQFEETFSISPLVLNNIKGKYILKQI